MAIVGTFFTILKKSTDLKYQFQKFLEISKSQNLKISKSQNLKISKSEISKKSLQNSLFLEISGNSQKSYTILAAENPSEYILRIFFWIKFNFFRTFHRFPKNYFYFRFEIRYNFAEAHILRISIFNFLTQNWKSQIFNTRFYSKKFLQFWEKKKNFCQNWKIWQIRTGIFEIWDVLRPVFFAFLKI